MIIKLTIITINLNNKLGLEKTIQSVISQTFAEFEYIIIDGASNDGSINIIKRYERRINYWVSELDKGIYNAMNKGISRANGEYLLFLNSGDFLLNIDTLNEVFGYEFKDDIVVGNCILSKQGKIISEVAPPDTISFRAFYKQTIPHQSSFIRRELFNTLGNYSEKFKYYSDLFFFINAIVINNCSYLHIPVNVSNFNLDGQTNKEENQSILSAEYDMIVNTLIPPRILLDYEELYNLHENYLNQEKELNRYAHRFSKIDKVISTIKKHFFKMSFWK